jgi:hypothetical protein
MISIGRQMDKKVDIHEIPVREGYDLIVAGGGIAGVSAAVSAARHGLKTAVFEKSAVLGGLATLGLINWYEPLCDGEGRLLVTGVAEELLRLSIEYGYDNLPVKWRGGGDGGGRIGGGNADNGGSGGSRSGVGGGNGINANAEPDEGRYATVFNPAIFSLALTKLLLDHDIVIKYDILASYPVMENGVCAGVVTESKSFREYYPAKTVVDATGDADLLHRAGAPCRNGRTYQTYLGHGCTFAGLGRALENRDMAKLQSSYNTGSDLYGNGQPDGMELHEGISNDIINISLLTGQTALLKKIIDMPKDERGLYALPGMAQLRKTRCLIGAATFTGVDGRHYDDSIGATGDFRRRGRHYEIPAGVLYNAAFPNILAAGRTVSADGDGWEITRVIPTAALTGQAAGVFASMSASRNLPASEIPIKDVQKALEKDGVTLKF